MLLGGAAARRTVRVSRTFSDAFLSFLRQTYAEADRNNDGLLDPVEFQFFLQKATLKKDATLEQAKEVLLAVTRKEEGPINFMQVMNSWHLIGEDMQNDTPSDDVAGLMGGAAALRQLRRQTVANISSPSSPQSQSNTIPSSPKNGDQPPKASPAPVGNTPTVAVETVQSTPKVPATPTSSEENGVSKAQEEARLQVAEMEKRLEKLRAEIKKSELEASSKQEYLRTLEARLSETTVQLQSKQKALANAAEADDDTKEPNDTISEEEDMQRLDATISLKKREIKELEDRLVAVEEQLAQKLERKEQIETMMKRLLERLLEKEAQLVKLEKHFEDTRHALKKEVQRNESNIRKLQKKVLSLSEKESQPSPNFPDNSSGSSLASAGSDLASQVVDGKLSSSSKRVKLTSHDKQSSKDSSSEDTRSSLSEEPAETRHSRRESKGASDEVSGKRRETYSGSSRSRESRDSKDRRESRERRDRDSGSSERSTRSSIGGETDKPKDKSSRREYRRQKSMPQHSSGVTSSSSPSTPEVSHRNTKNDVLDWYLNDADRMKLVMKSQQIARRVLQRKQGKGLSALVGQYSVAEQSKSARQRNAALHEIFTTEKSYHESLKKLNDVYITPIRRMKILSEDEADRIFSDIEIIVEITHAILEKMDGRLKLWPSVQRVGDIFKDMAPLMKLYYRYIRDFEKMQQRLSEIQHQYPDFDQFIQKAARERAGGMTLLSFLIMPVQRLPRYELLLKGLLKLTDEAHLDFANLAAAVDAVVSVNQYINSRKRKEELKHTVETLLSKKSSRKLLVLGKTDQKQFLKITVSQARGLPAIDSTGTSDPFVEIQFEDEEWRTKVQYKTLSPIWHEDFVLVILPSSPPTFSMSVYDYDRIGTNTLIGTIRLRVQDFLSKPKDLEEGAWYSLSAPSKKKYEGAAGEVYLSFSVVTEL